MPTLHVEAEVSPDELLQAVDQLSMADLERFVSRVLALRARRVAPSLPPEEAALLVQINRGLPAELRARLRLLNERSEDEALTPDSSRFWPADQYEAGKAQPSFDKQFVRDHLEAIGWNKQPPVPSLPDDVITRTREKYLEAYRRLTGRELAL